MICPGCGALVYPESFPGSHDCHHAVWCPTPHWPDDGPEQKMAEDSSDSAASQEDGEPDSGVCYYLVDEQDLVIDHGQWKMAEDD